MKYHKLLIAVVATLVCWAGVRPSLAQHLEKIRLGYSGTGINNYVLEMGKRTGIFKKKRPRSRGSLRERRFVT